MFKGLRTKIESEQKDQASVNNFQATKSRHISANNGSISTNTNNSRAESNIDSPLCQIYTPKSEPYFIGENEPKIAATTNLETAPSILDQKTIKLNQSETYSYQSEIDGALQTVDQFRDEVARLRTQLKSVIKERDDSNDQNGQLYQLIEKLRRHLESEKETNSNLRSKLEESEKKVAEITQTQNESSKRGAKSSSKSFDPSTLDSTSLSNELQSNDTEDLRKHVMELQRQITDRNRQLKIRQQNLTDIKRHLQMEIADHARTREELTMVQNQLKQANQLSSATSESVTPQNGSNSCDIESNGSGQAPNENSGSTTNASLIHSDGHLETKRGPESQVSQNQYDNISCKSRSSNSVDDNDLHDHLNNYSNNEINNEYLKNVLFRYMTSTDVETAKHLVKALSVMMNFSPEQTAAIKSAMSARSSWLRLK